MSERKYGCHNRPRPAPDATYRAQSGWSDYTDCIGQPNRWPIYVDVQATFGTTSCQYDKSATDAKCAGCNHAKEVGRV